MQALSSYSPAAHTAVESALRALTVESLGFAASSYFSGRGVFARFVWPDWPVSLKEQLAADVKQFHQIHPELVPESDGSPAWQAVFHDWHTDSESVSIIAESFSKHFPGRVAWVQSERDSRGRIGASCVIQGLLQIPAARSDGPMAKIVQESMARRAVTVPCSLQLSWKDYTATPPGPLSDSDRDSFQASVREIFAWASGRIQPILDILNEKLKTLYGDRCRGLYVFGSYARPDAGIELPDSSDLDLALILADFGNIYDEQQVFGDIVNDLSLEHSLVISVVPIREADFREGQSNFTRVISEYAIPVA